MKSILLALVLTVGLSCNASVPPNIHADTHKIEQLTMFGLSHCSATAIGPHTLLTASHCEVATDDIGIDGKDVAKITRIVRDNFDHSILYLKDVTFKVWAEFDKEGQIGDDVFIFGNPGHFDDLLRKGYIAGHAPFHIEEVNLDIPITLLDLNGFFGDSGSGVFNTNGKLIGVVSTLSVQQSDKAQSKYMGMMPMNFTEQQLEEARKF
jgi:hypothetical protein